MYRPHRTFRSQNTPEPEEGVVKKSEVNKLALGILACATHYEVLGFPQGLTRTKCDRRTVFWPASFTRIGPPGTTMSWRASTMRIRA
jgi:hypothetical protein